MEKETNDQLFKWQELSKAARRKKVTEEREKETLKDERLEEDKRKVENKEQGQSIETEKKRCGGDSWNYRMIIGNSEYDCPGLTDLPSIKEDRKLISDTPGKRNQAILISATLKTQLILTTTHMLKTSSDGSRISWMRWMRKRQKGEEMEEKQGLPHQLHHS